MKIYGNLIQTFDAFEQCVWSPGKDEKRKYTQGGHKGDTIREQSTSFHIVMLKLNINMLYTMNKKKQQKNTSELSTEK